MMACDPIEVIYGGLDKLGPGTDEFTRQVLRDLPREHFSRVVDAGCGSGRQTLVLAAALETPIHALDNHAPFLRRLEQRAEALGLARKVVTHCMDMADLADAFGDVDLLWSEGSIYNLGFARGLEAWAPALAEGGCLVASEMCWLDGTASARVQRFWHEAYPGMGSVEQNCRSAAAAGYRVLSTRVLPRQAWREGYYDILGPRAETLLQHEDPTVRAMAAENIEEIAVFDEAADSCGYVFFSLQR
jgi:SAM-dependent methyltransferase